MRRPCAPGYYGDGTINADDPAAGNFVIPPSPLRTIGDALNEKGVSWRYYGEGWNNYLKTPKDYASNYYCDICNPFQYTSSIMADPNQRQEHLKDVTDFDADVQNGSLPAVSYVKPGGLTDGHPASSKWNLFEAFTKRIIDEVKANPDLWASTAIIVTTDEGG